MQVDAEYRPGQIVYHRCAAEKRPGIVTGLLVRSTGVLYCVSWGDCSETSHFGYELTDEYVPGYAAED